FQPWRWYVSYSQRRLQGFGMADAARLASGRPCEREKAYDVPVWVLGRQVAIVRVPGASAAGAEDFALRYVAANTYPHETAESDRPLPACGREVVLVPLARVFSKGGE
ncbi:MAG TPA: hypothetical protein VGH54_21755, partial [Mycobacterium sp.]|uniref:hypothetical protein n=1 Tax=Mycobacterium sp. TaxID=1785 RepID=UPI002F3E3967